MSIQNQNQSVIGTYAQSTCILGTAAIFTDLGTAARAASVIYDGPALGRTEVGTHPGTSTSSASQTHLQPAIRPVRVLRFLES